MAITTECTVCHYHLAAVEVLEDGVTVGCPKCDEIHWMPKLWDDAIALFEMCKIPVQHMYKSPYAGIDAFVYKENGHKRIIVSSAPNNRIDVYSQYRPCDVSGWYWNGINGEWEITL